MSENPKAEITALIDAYNKAARTRKAGLLKLLQSAVKEESKAWDELMGKIDAVTGYKDTIVNCGFPSWEDVLGALKDAGVGIDKSDAMDDVRYTLEHPDEGEKIARRVAARFKAQMNSSLVRNPRA